MTKKPKSVYNKYEAARKKWLAAEEALHKARLAYGEANEYCRESYANLQELANQLSEEDLERARQAQFPNSSSSAETV